jgi:hypothetical protein
VGVPHALCCFLEYAARSCDPLSLPTVLLIIPLGSSCSWKLVVSLILIEVLIVSRGF